MTTTTITPMTITTTTTIFLGWDLIEINLVLCHYCFFKQPIYRLRTELAKLRKMYEEQTEKAKNEFMYLHSNKVRLNV